MREWTGTQRRQQRQPARWVGSSWRWLGPHCILLVMSACCDACWQGLPLTAPVMPPSSSLAQPLPPPTPLPTTPSSLQAYTWAVALQLFALRQAGASAELSSAAGAARGALAAASATLDGYVQQFLSMARTAASAAESHALLQRCRATLDTAAAQEQQLAGQEQQGRAALVGVLADAQPVAVQVLAALQECQVRGAGKSGGVRPHWWTCVVLPFVHAVVQCPNEKMKKQMLSHDMGAC